MIRFLRVIFGGCTPTVPISLLPGDPPPMPSRPPFPVVDYPLPEDLKGLVSVALRCGGPREQLRALNGPCLRVAEVLRLPECVSVGPGDAAAPWS